MQLNSQYTTHDMRLSNILQQYDYTFSYGLKLFTIWHKYSRDSGIVSEIFQPVSWEEYWPFQNKKTSDILWRWVSNPNPNPKHNSNPNHDPRYVAT